MKIQALGYDPEADELDLLIDEEVPQPAEMIPLDAGVYIRRDIASGRVVGAVIRGYTEFLRLLLAGYDLPREAAKKSGLENEFIAIVEWQKTALKLSQDLVRHLGTPAKEQQALVETLLSQTA